MFLVVPVKRKTNTKMKKKNTNLIYSVFNKECCYLQASTSSLFGLSMERWANKEEIYNIFHSISQPSES